MSLMKQKEFDVVALGELLIDFTQNGLSEQGNCLFEANPGGAPCNVLSMLNNLGNKTAFIGKVGQDQFGRILRKTLEDIGIVTQNLIMDEKYLTTLAFVHTLNGGDRDFSFYRIMGADMMLTVEEISEELIASAKVFHFGTLSMTNDEVRKATKKAVDIAKTNNNLISFDPNIREPLWETLELAKEQVIYGLGVCDILKISDDEIQWLTGEQDYTIAINKIRDKFSIPLIVLSLGIEGSRAYYKDLVVEAHSFVQENTIDTTGAGDTFFACIIDYILKNGLSDLTIVQLKEMLTFANVAASIITTKKGALKVMPTMKEIEVVLSK